MFSWPAQDLLRLIVLYMSEQQPWPSGGILTADVSLERGGTTLQ